MLDMTRAVSTCARQNPFEFDDCAPDFYELARSKTFADPAVSPLLQAHILYTQLDAKRIEGDGSTSQCARCSRPHRFPSQRHLDVVQLLLTDDLVIEHPSRTCSADANPYLVAGATGRASRSRVSRPAHSHPSHCRLPALAFCTSTTPNAMRPVTAKPLPACPPRLRPHHVWYIDPDALLRPCPQGFATPRPRAPQIRHAAGAALPPHARCPPPHVSNIPYRIHRFPRLPPTTTISGAAPFSRGPNYHLHHHPRAQRSQWLFFIAGAAPFFCPRTIVAHPRRDSATRTSAVPHLPPRFFRLIRPRLAGAWRAPSASRRLSQGTVYSTTTPRAISHATTNPLHAARDVLRDYDVLMRAIAAHASPDPHRQPHGQRMTLAFLVPALRDRLDQCTTLTARPPRLPRSSGPPATPPASAARATVVLIAGAAFHVRQPLSTAHAAFVASPCTLAILSAVPPPSKPAPGTHHEHDAHALHAAYPCAREYDAHHHQRTSTRCSFPHHPRHFRPVPMRAPSAAPQHHLRAPRTFPTVCAVPITSDHRADPFRHPTARHPRFPYTARRHRQHPPTALHALTASIFSATTRPRRVHRRTETTRSRRSSSSYAEDPAVLPPRARGSSGRLSGTPTHRKRARARGGKGYLLRDCWRSAGSDAAYISFSPFFVYRSFMYFM
ncbi:hypothetical protein B0H13DRAFT_2385869 [Mycena leptocephala]|nr:hypothetical protein B0H13DRAFT_2385869 [Mycena leptocephala]